MKIFLFVIIYTASVLLIRWLNMIIDKRKDEYNPLMWLWITPVFNTIFAVIGGCLVLFLYMEESIIGKKILNWFCYKHLDK